MKHKKQPRMNVSQSNWHLPQIKKKSIISLILLTPAFTLIILFAYWNITTYIEPMSFFKERNLHSSMLLNDEEISRLTELIDAREFFNILRPILVERVVGTESHEKVKDYIAGYMRSLSWSVELDTFLDTAPKQGQLKFTNIMATLNPNAARHLVLACHYDSKLMGFPFLGATDSAVPCAMLLMMGKILTNSIKAGNPRNMNNDRVTLKFIFFDGEEAFESWTKTDSLYGSRHLAGVMEKTEYQKDARTNRIINHLHRMDMLILLDLLGASQPTFYSYFEKTHKWYLELAQIENLLRQKELIAIEPGQKTNYFVQAQLKAGISDDHEPFLRRGVPVVHLIPTPFPSVWHTRRDNLDVVNPIAVKNLIAILQVFAVQYVHGFIANEKVATENRVWQYGQKQPRRAS